MSNDLAVKDEAVLAMFKEDSKADMGDIDGGELVPQLKLTHKQSENELMDGNLARPGKYYHTATKEQYDDLQVNLLYIKKTEMMRFDKSGTQLTYIVGGIIREKNVPFIMYVKGISLGQLFEYMKKINEYMSHPDMPIPMYALVTRLSTVDRDSKYGKVKAMNFEVVKNDKNQPVIETDMKTITMFKEGIPKIKGAIDRMLSKDSRQEDTYEESILRGDSAQDMGVDQISEVEDLSDDIPF
jgi:hypothetical protein